MKQRESGEKYASQNEAYYTASPQSPLNSVSVWRRRLRPRPYSSFSIRVFPLAVVTGMDHFDGGGFSIVGPGGGFYAILQRPGGTVRTSIVSTAKNKCFFIMLPFRRHPS